MAQEIVITRGVTFTNRVPVDERHYPGMTAAEAARYERKVDHDNKMELFIEQLTSAVDPVFTESIEVHAVPD
jgi:hypothetical protein